MSKTRSLLTVSLVMLAASGAVVPKAASQAGNESADLQPLKPSLPSGQPPASARFLTGRQATDLLVGELAKTKSISLEDARRAVDQTTSILDFKTAHESDQAFGDVWAEYRDGRYSVHLRVADGSDPDGLSREFKESVGSDVQVTIGGLQYIVARRLVDEVSEAVSLRDVAAEVVYDHVNGKVQLTTDDLELQTRFPSLSR